MRFPRINLTKTLNLVALFTQKHSPEILTGIGIAGMITTVIFSVRATPRALEYIEERKVDEEKEKLSAIETIQVAGKYYIPSLIIGAASIACVIGSNAVGYRRYTALMAAYAVSESSNDRLENKLRDLLGEKKCEEIHDSQIKDILNEEPPEEDLITRTGMGDTLCMDMLSGRYFMHDLAEVRNIINILNNRLLKDNQIQLNEFYEMVGLPCIKFGEDYIWRREDGLIQMHLTSQLIKDRPCAVIEFLDGPFFRANHW